MYVRTIMENTNVNLKRVLNAPTQTWYPPAVMKGNPDVIQQTLPRDHHSFLTQVTTPRTIGKELYSHESNNFPFTKTIVPVGTLYDRDLSYYDVRAGKKTQVWGQYMAYPRFDYHAREKSSYADTILPVASLGRWSPSEPYHDNYQCGIPNRSTN